MSDRRTHHLFLSALLFPAILLQPALRAQQYPPYVYSVNNSADYGTTIAQGSLFVIFGYNIGPATLVQVSSFPLPNVLAGTSVTVQSGSTTLNCPMVYTSFGQAAAILPSSVPAGPANVTVMYGGTGPQFASSAQVTVAPSSFGVFTTSRGFGAGSVTALDGTLKTFGTTAKPGEIVILWGTGIGPVSGQDNILPTSYPNFPNVQVWVGGQSAQIAYAGRSGCCVGVDQIAFTVPAIANGCNVPVTVVSGGVSSNTVTLPVSGSTGACTDSGPSLPAPLLAKAVAGQPVKVAAIAIGPAVLGRNAPNPQSLARRLSAALHTPVSEADASLLMSAYANRNPRAVRSAMAKFASQWKALDRPTRDRILIQFGQAQQGAAAFFGSFNNEGIAAALGSAEVPVAGACVVPPGSYPSALGSASAGLDAGASLLLTGAAGSSVLKLSNTKGQYYALFGSSLTGPNIPLGAYTISGSGGKDVGAFSATISVGNHLAISNKSSLSTVNRTKPLTVTWTGGVAGSYVLIGGNTPNGSASAVRVPNANFACAEDGGKGAFTIPAYILSSMNATGPAKGTILISPHPLSNQIAIPGIDLAYFVDGSTDSAIVTFM